MTLDPNDAAKRAFIAYRQLEAIAKQPLIARANRKSYNRLLDTLKDCFSLDESFLSSISHLQHLPDEGVSAAVVSLQLEADAQVLLATTHTFVELYLSPEDKKKAIGFGT